MTMCVNFVKIRLVVFDFYAEGHSQVSQSLASEINKIDYHLRIPAHFLDQNTQRVGIYRKALSRHIQSHKAFDVLP